MYMFLNYKVVCQNQIYYHLGFQHTMCCVCECHYTHIFMVLLKVDELLLQGFDLALQVHAAHVGVVDELPQTDDVGLHGLADGQLGLVSKQNRAGR